MNLLESVSSNGKLFCGDCINIMKNIPDESIDMIICDPPFGITRNEWDIVIPFEDMWKEYKRITSKNAIIAIFSAQPFTSYLITSNPQMFKYEWIWEKTIQRNHLNAKKMPLRVHENIIIFAKSTKTIYNPQMTESNKIIRISRYKRQNNGCYGAENRNTYYESNKRYPRDVIKIPNGISNRIHSTQKPPEIYEYFIKTYTNEASTILDNCAGSGVLGEVCERLNRNYIMIEKSEEMCKNIVTRIKSIKSKNYSFISLFD